jgi:hypothetical protein
MAKLDVYALADSLGIVLKLGSDGVILGGSGTAMVPFAWTQVPVPIEIVSSKLLIDGHALVCKTVGNVVLLAITGLRDEYKVSIFVVDLAKMKGRPEGILDGIPATAVAGVALAFDDMKAIVAEYGKTQHDTWVRVPPHAYVLDGSREPVDQEDARRIAEGSKA